MDVIKSLADLVTLSHLYGSNKDFIIAGGGNTSFKDDRSMWIKASGIALTDIEQGGFVQIDRGKLTGLLDQAYPTQPFRREAEVKEYLLRCRTAPEKNQRPSVESSLHEMIHYPFVVHTHPYVVNAVLCSENARQTIDTLFSEGLGGTPVLYIEYVDPGYTLAMHVKTQLNMYRGMHKEDPHVIFLENHGIIVSTNTAAEIRELYTEIISRIQAKFKSKLDYRETPPVSNKDADHFMLKLKEILGNPSSVAVWRNNSLVEYFLSSDACRDMIRKPFTPDIVVYCKGAPLLLLKYPLLADIERALPAAVDEFRGRWQYPPKIIVLPGFGMVAVDETAYAANGAADMFEDFMKIAYFTADFGGPHPLTDREIKFIDTWEVENYRRQIAKGKK